MFAFGDSRHAFDCNQICNMEQKHHLQDLQMVHCKKMHIHSNKTLNTNLIVQHNYAMTFVNDVLEVVYEALLTESWIKNVWKFIWEKGIPFKSNTKKSN